jgi:spore germination protein
MAITFWLMKLFGKQTKFPTFRPFEYSSHAEDSPEVIAECTEIDKRLEWFQQSLSNSSDVQYHTFVAGPDVKCALIYLKGMIDRKTVEQSVLSVITMLDSVLSKEQFIAQILEKKHLPIAQQSVQNSLKEALCKLLNRDALLLIDDDARMLAVSVVSFEKRAIEDPKMKRSYADPTRHLWRILRRI